MSDNQNEQQFIDEYNRLLNEEKQNIEKDIVKQIHKIKDTLAQRQVELAKSLSGPMEAKNQKQFNRFQKQLDQTIQNLDLFPEK